MKTLRGVKIVVDESNEEAKKYRDALESEFKKREISIVPYREPKNIKLVIILGGDGAMLETAHGFNFGSTFLGINCGHIGFLMNDGDPQQVADRILTRNFKVHQFPLLRIESETGWSKLAVNDVYFNRIAGKAAKFRVKVNGIEFRERITGDGILICTGLGSTGYYVSAGGSIIYPKLPVVGLMFLNCKPPFRFIHKIFPLESEIEVIVLSPPQEIKGFYDGFELPYFQKIKIRKSGHTIKLAFWLKENFTERLIDKIIKVQEV